MYVRTYVPLDESNEKLNRNHSSTLTLLVLGEYSLSRMIRFSLYIQRCERSSPPRSGDEKFNVTAAGTTELCFRRRKPAGAEAEVETLSSVAVVVAFHRRNTLQSKSSANPRHSIPPASNSFRLLLRVIRLLGGKPRGFSMRVALAPRERPARRKPRKGVR